jgi:HPt (histidine-containing phosphotransfer) domain-containing protein
MAHADLFNFEYLDTLVQGNSIMRKQLMEILPAQIASDMRVMREAIATGDTVIIRRASHKFRSTLLYTGNTDAQHLNDAIEQIAHDGESPESIQRSWAALEALLTRMLLALTPDTRSNERPPDSRDLPYV